MSSSYILAAKRTPIGKLLGSLSEIPAPQLAAVAIRAALTAANVAPDQVQEVILGNVLQAGVGQAPARQAALAAGIPVGVPAMTINKVCGSGLKAVMLADQAIRAGDARLIVAGGMENMSLAPHLAMKSRGGWKFGSQTLLDSMQHDGLTCAHERTAMGNLADYIADKHRITREEQDSFALTSHQRAAVAKSSGKFDGEIVPVPFRVGKNDLEVISDEGPRDNANAVDLARLRPAFSPTGTATAGNASQISDGAAVLIVADEATARACDSRLKARIVASHTSGVEPKDLFIAPVSAIEKVLAKASLKLADIDLVELNEAFAAQCLACMKPLGLSHEKTNVHGGAIALGHPIGASGARVLVTLLHALSARGLCRGLASLCLGGGNAVAMIVERC
ncbi:MAG: acetyl-CoA C-acyltransferase [Pirellulaceae bacterium]